MAAAVDVPPIANGKTGTVWTAVGHIFCAVVGAGVLGLPNSLAWLGWVAGPMCLCIFFAISLWSAHLLAQLYQVDGIEFARYHHAVQHILGRTGSIAVAVFQMLNLVLSCIAYSITGAIAMRTISGYLGTQPTKEWQFVLIMGAIELVFSQIPSLEEIWWVSALGTISSLGYVLITLGLGLAYSGNHAGSIGGRPGTSPANKIFSIFSSLGNLAFAFGFAQVLLEIQDTLRQPPKAQGTMQKAVSVSVTSAFCFYISSAVACYAALGNDVPGEVLEGFEQAPDWVMILANILIAVHMVTAWQVWAQPVYETIESHVKARFLRRQLAVRDGAAAAAAEGKAGAAADKEAEGHLPAVAEDVLEGGGSLSAGGASTAVSLRGSSTLSSRRMSRRSMGTMSVSNSAPIPDLVPQDWHPRSERLRPVHSSADNLPTLAASNTTSKGLSHHHLGRLSALSSLGSAAMYHLDTGAANERVPLNDQGYLLPFWQRLLIRSSFVGLCTLVACVVPFFSAVVGLVGAITFWPLTIGFPFAMYVKVFKPEGGIVVLMKVVAAVMLVVAVAATIGSFQNILVSWSTYKLFS